MILAPAYIPVVGEGAHGVSASMAVTSPECEHHESGAEEHAKICGNSVNNCGNSTCTKSSGDHDHTLHHPQSAREVQELVRHAKAYCQPHAMPLVIVSGDNEIAAPFEGGFFGSPLELPSVGISSSDPTTAIPISADPTTAIAPHQGVPCLRINPMASDDTVSKINGVGGKRSAPFVIDLSALNSIETNSDTLTCRVGGGCTVDEVEAALLQENLIFPSTPAWIGDLGCSRSVTTNWLHGSRGFFDRKFGLGVENILEVEIVTADGELRVCSDVNENADLFWAVRGAGSFFGVVTSITIGVFPLKASEFLAGSKLPRFGSVSKVSKGTSSSAKKSSVISAALTNYRRKGGRQAAEEGAVSNNMCGVVLSSDVNSNSSADDSSSTQQQRGGHAVAQQSDFAVVTRERERQNDNGNSTSLTARASRLLLGKTSGCCGPFRLSPNINNRDDDDHGSGTRSGNSNNNHHKISGSCGSSSSSNVEGASVKTAGAPTPRGAQHDSPCTRRSATTAPVPILAGRSVPAVAGHDATARLEVVARFADFFGPRADRNPNMGGGLLLPVGGRIQEELVWLDSFSPDCLDEVRKVQDEQKMLVHDDDPKITPDPCRRGTEAASRGPPAPTDYEIALNDAQTSYVWKNHFAHGMAEYQREYFAPASEWSGNVNHGSSMILRNANGGIPDWVPRELRSLATASIETYGAMMWASKKLTEKIGKSMHTTRFGWTAVDELALLHGSQSSSRNHHSQRGSSNSCVAGNGTSRISAARSPVSPDCGSSRRASFGQSGKSSSKHSLGSLLRGMGAASSSGGGRRVRAQMTTVALSEITPRVLKILCHATAKTPASTTSCGANKTHTGAGGISGGRSDGCEQCALILIPGISGGMVGSCPRMFAGKKSNYYHVRPLRRRVQKCVPTLGKDATGTPLLAAGGSGIVANSLLQEASAGVSSTGDNINAGLNSADLDSDTFDNGDDPQERMAARLKKDFDFEGTNQSHGVVHALSEQNLKRAFPTEQNCSQSRIAKMLSWNRDSTLASDENVDRAAAAPLRVCIDSCPSGGDLAETPSTTAQPARQTTTSDVDDNASSLHVGSPTARGVSRAVSVAPLSGDADADFVDTEEVDHDTFPAENFCLDHTRRSSTTQSGGASSTGVPGGAIIPNGRTKSVTRHVSEPTNTRLPNFVVRLGAGNAEITGDGATSMQVVEKNTCDADAVSALSTELIPGTKNEQGDEQNAKKLFVRPESFSPTRRDSVASTAPTVSGDLWMDSPPGVCDNIHGKGSAININSRRSSIDTTCYHGGSRRSSVDTSVCSGSRRASVETDFEGADGLLPHNVDNSVSGRGPPSSLGRTSRRFTKDMMTGEERNKLLARLGVIDDYNNVERANKTADEHVDQPRSLEISGSLGVPNIRIGEIDVEDRNVSSEAPLNQVSVAQEHCEGVCGAGSITSPASPHPQQKPLSAIYEEGEAAPELGLIRKRYIGGSEHRPRDSVAHYHVHAAWQVVVVAGWQKTSIPRTKGAEHDKKSQDSRSNSARKSPTSMYKRMFSRKGSVCNSNCSGTDVKGTSSALRLNRSVSATVPSNDLGASDLIEWDHEIAARRILPNTGAGVPAAQRYGMQKAISATAATYHHDSREGAGRAGSLIDPNSFSACKTASTVATEDSLFRSHRSSRGNNALGASFLSTKSSEEENNCASTSKEAEKALELEKSQQQAEIEAASLAHAWANDVVQALCKTGKVLGERVSSSTAGGAFAPATSCIGPGHVEEVFAGNFPRLASLKGRYDCDNLFENARMPCGF